MGYGSEQFRSLLKEAAFRLTEPTYFEQRQDAWQQSVALCSILAENELQLPTEQYSVGIKRSAELIQQFSHLIPTADVLFLNEVPRMRYLQWFSSNVRRGSGHKLDTTAYEKARRNGLIWQLYMHNIYEIDNRRLMGMEFSVIHVEGGESVKERGIIIRFNNEKLMTSSQPPLSLELCPTFLEQKVKKAELEDNNNRLQILTERQWFTFYKISQIEGDGIYFTRLTENKGKPKKIKTTSVRSWKKPSYTPGVMPV